MAELVDALVIKTETRKSFGIVTANNNNALLTPWSWVRVPPLNTALSGTFRVAQLVEQVNNTIPHLVQQLSGRAGPVTTPDFVTDWVRFPSGPQHQVSAFAPSQKKKGRMVSGPHPLRGVGSCSPGGDYKNLGIDHSLPILRFRLPD